MPLTKEQILETARELRRIIDPELVIMAEVAGRPAGALLAIPNINVPLAAVRGRLFPFGFIRFFRELKRVREAQILGVAALREERAKGITALLFIEVILRGLKRGYRKAEASWVLEDNQMSNQSIQGRWNRRGIRRIVFLRRRSRDRARTRGRRNSRRGFATCWNSNSIGMAM